MNSPLVNGGKSEYLALKTLHPHPQAQRVFDKTHAAKMIANFDPAAIGEITVARTKRNRLWIVDGQHRAHAALAFVGGDASQLIRCWVVDVNDDAEAARLFLLLNTHKSVRTIDKFRVRVVEKDVVAVAIISILSSFGLAVEDSPRDGSVQAVAALEGIYARLRGEALLRRVLGVLHAAWGASRDAYDARLLRGLALLFVRHGDAINTEEMARKLAKCGTPIEFVGRARSLKNISGGDIAHAMAECIRNEYNKGRRTEKLEERAE